MVVRIYPIGEDVYLSGWRRYVQWWNMFDGKQVSWKCYVGCCEECGVTVGRGAPLWRCGNVHSSNMLG